MNDHNSTSLVDFLAALIASRRSGVPSRADIDDAVPVGTRAAAQRDVEIAKELVTEAVRSGLPFTHERVVVDELGGGNTAEVVVRVTLHAPFVFKLDERMQKLAREGEAIRRIKQNRDLPEAFRAAWPVVYAVRPTAPYAYLMEFFPREDGWLSLEDRLYGSALAEDEPPRLLDAVLDLLFCGYEGSRDPRHRPSVEEDYVKRIKERLSATAQQDSEFASRPIRINGTELPPWQDSIAAVSKANLQALGPAFTTVVHGDPNPGNIMLRSSSTGELELKLIDPKEWTTGDYLFDVAKLTHFIEATGPVEKPSRGSTPRVNLTTATTPATLSYVVEQPSWTGPVVAACREKAAAFATAHGDREWEARYELGMAANLLGLPLGRLQKGRRDAAMILFGEGLLWLNRFSKRLP
jgi:hypothetical protein